MNQTLYRSRFFLSGTALLSLSLFGCEKEVVNVTNTDATQPTSYLKFASAESLKSALTEISKSPDKEAALEKIRGVYTVGAVNEKFHSLLTNPDKNVPVLNAKGRAAYKASSKVKYSEAILAADEVVTDQLVPDPNFATVLNDQLEIQVGNQFVKVTPQGTYFADAANKAALDAIATDNAQDPDDVEPGVAVGGDTYDMGKGVSRFDTYGTATNVVELQDISQLTSGGGTGVGLTNGSPTTAFSSPCDIAQPAGTKYSSALSLQQYCGFPSYGYGSHTVVGGWLQGIFGANSDRTENFDDTHRVKVKLYNFNYWVYSSIGLKAKFQKRGWTRIWDKQSCDKITLGWDAVIFEAPQVYSAPSPYNSTSFPGSGVANAIAGEKFTFINFEVPANIISELSQSLLGQTSWNSSSDLKDKLESQFKDLAKSQISSVTTTLWNYVEKKYAPTQVAFNTSVTTGFRMIFPDKVTIALSRWEKSADNTGEVDLIFDWNTCRLTYTNTIGGNLDWGKNVVAPTYSNRAYSYTVKKASIYGAAKYNGMWKGVRIVQE